MLNTTFNFAPYIYVLLTDGCGYYNEVQIYGSEDVVVYL